VGFLSGLKRLARSKIVRGAIGTVVGSVPGGAAAMKLLSAGKQLGATVQANRLAKRQGRATAAAVTRLANIKRPGIMQTPSERRATDWIKEATNPDLQTARVTDPRRSGAPSKSTRKRAKSPNSSRPKRKRGRGSPKEHYPDDTAEDTKAANARARRKKKPKDPNRQKRKLSPGMQARANHTKAIAAQWREAGKPGKFFDYLKKFPYKG